MRKGLYQPSVRLIYKATAELESTLTCTAGIHVLLRHVLSLVVLVPPAVMHDI
jgi:hypothetical protein